MRLIIWLIFIAISQYACTQEKNDERQEGKGVYPIAFYNVENLFDTERDPAINDSDFTPEGKYQWTQDKYLKKLTNLAYVISQLGKDESQTGFAILGVAEVENRKVMEDLIHTGKLAENNYQIVHHDSPDERGIDVGLIYDPQLFNHITYKIYPFTLPGDRYGSNYKTRDILVVSGLLAGEPICVLVNHWPSRRGDDSEALRERAGAICRHISDSIYKEDPQTGIIIMGDLNDNPKDKSVRVALGAKRNKEEVQPGGLFNTMWQVLDKGIGSERYRDTWNLFDQIIISESLLNQGSSKLTYKRSYVFNRKFLIQQSGNYRGYPLRTFSGTTFLNGYSDHFPTLIYLTK
jgi:hypothetical protein